MTDWTRIFVYAGVFGLGDAHGIWRDGDALNALAAAVVFLALAAALDWRNMRKETR